MSLIRRRMMMAKKPSGGTWSYELHLTPEWEEGLWWGEPATAYMEGDFSELEAFLIALTTTLGEYIAGGNYGSYSLETIPPGVNITVDGELITSVMYYLPDGPVTFACGDDVIYVNVSADMITMDKYI